MGKIIDATNYANVIDAYLFDYRFKIAYHKLCYCLRLDEASYLLDFFIPTIENNEYWFLVGWLWFEFAILKRGNNGNTNNTEY